MTKKLVWENKFTNTKKNTDKSGALFIPYFNLFLKKSTKSFKSSAEYS